MPTNGLKRRAHESEMVRFSEICDRLGIHTNTGYAWLRSGNFPIAVEKLGSHYYARRVDVEAFFSGGQG